MFYARTQIDVHNGRASIERIGKISDSLIGFGPVAIGLDGLLAWIPGVGELYSLGAGAAMVVEGARARAPVAVLAQVSAIVLLRTFSNLLPVAGSVVVDLFRGHRWAAKLLTKAIDETLYIEGAHSLDHPEYATTLGRIRSGDETRRVVFLG
jgi:hypothetical protein